MASRTTTGMNIVLKAIRWLSTNAIDRSSSPDMKTIGKLRREKWNHGQQMILICLIGCISIYKRYNLCVISPEYIGTPVNRNGTE